MPGCGILQDSFVYVLGLLDRSQSGTDDLHRECHRQGLEYTWTISSMLCVYVDRVNDGDDTFTGSANLYEIDIHYEIDSIGSRQELIK